MNILIVKMITNAPPKRKHWWSKNPKPFVVPDRYIKKEGIVVGDIVHFEDGCAGYVIGELQLHHCILSSHAFSEK